ncbi:MAG: HD domain-containing phosphohydrolase [Synergistaceae bacterium]
MDQTVFVPLFNNAALLLVLSVIYEATYLLPYKYRNMQPVFNGILIALICVLIMSMPFTLQPGVIYDTRSILICVTALFFGPIPTAVTVAAAALFRISIGGAGTLPGIATITTSALIGLAWRRWLYPKSNKWQWLSIYAMSLTVHITMLACMLLLPYPESLNVIRKIAVPVMVVYPAASVLLSLLLMRQQDRRRLNDALKESEKKYKSYIENAPDGIFITDEAGHYTEVNTAASEITGYSKDELLNMKISDFLPDGSKEAGANHFNKLLETGSSKGELQFKHKNGSTRWWSVDAVKLSDHRFLGFSKDITATKKAEEELLYMSYHDQLTELFNRRYFEIQTRKYDNNNELPLSVIMGDINGLKMINNAFGDAEGDRLIVDTAKIIKTCCREGDILARTGGGDFKILMPKTDFETSFSILREIQTACDAHNAKLSDEAYFINISMGCATKTAVEESFDSVMKIAENYMYQRKLLENKSSRSSIIASITATMYAKSQETEEHCGRLVEISKMIGEALKLSERELDKLTLLAKLHDIGKVGIPERILLNPGKLSEAEWVEMKKHPEIGYRIAVAAPELEPIAEYILYHQEHWDGKGYPKNLAGEKIPLLSRIIAIADAYDAMTQDRVYRKAITHQAALEEIKNNAGTQFDPQIAKLFVEVVSDQYMRKAANP